MLTYIEAHELFATAQPGLVRDIAQDFAHELAATNPRFKRDLFLRACGVES